MASPQMSPGDALAEQARQLAAAHAQIQALRQEAQQASELAYRSTLEADKLRADLEHAQAYRVKARQAKREAQELQQQLDRVRAQAAGQAAAAASGRSAEDTAGNSVQLQQHMDSQHNQRTECCVRCKELSGVISRLRQQLSESHGGATPDTAGRLAALEQDNMQLRRRLADVAAAAAMTQSGSPLADHPPCSPPPPPPPPPQQQQQQQRQGVHMQEPLTRQLEMVDQQRLQHPQLQRLPDAAEQAAAADADEASTDTTRAIFTLPSTSQEHDAAVQPLQAGRGRSPPASPARTPAERPLHQDTPCSKPPHQRGGAHEHLGKAAACQQPFQGAALPQHRLPDALGRSTAASAPTACRQPAANAAVLPQHDRTLKVDPAPSCHGPHSAEQQDRRQQQQVAQPQVAARKGWRQKRKAGCGGDMLASQQAPARLRSDQQMGPLHAHQPSSALIPRPVSPHVDGLACTPPEQQRAPTDGAQPTAPDTVAWASPLRPAADAAVTQAPATTARRKQLFQLDQQQQPQAAPGQRQEAPISRACVQHGAAQPAALIKPPARKPQQPPLAGQNVPPGNGLRPYKFTEVVRNKAAREAMQAGDCVDCRKWYEALESWDAGAPTLERPPCGHTPGVQSVQDAAAAHGRSSRHQMLQDAGRHRWHHAPPATPSGYWDMGFMDSLDSRVPQQE